jgi:hypothetical protein
MAMKPPSSSLNKNKPRLKKVNDSCVQPHISPLTRLQEQNNNDAQSTEKYVPNSKHTQRAAVIVNVANNAGATVTVLGITVLNLLFKESSSLLMERK